MGVPYDTFIKAFLSKISEYDFINLEDIERNELVDGYMKRAIASFKKICKYDLAGTGNDTTRAFDLDIPEEDLEEIADIISEGMVAQWMKPFTYRQENLENVLNTRDFSAYSPAELFLRISNVYASVRKDFTNMMREYSYNHGDLTDLHL